MNVRSTINAVALVLGLTIGTAVTVERAPLCTMLADSTDSPNADAQWAALVADLGTLDYVGGYSYGTVYAVDGGYAIGYSLAEDSTIWSDPACLASVPTTTTHR